MGGRREKTDNSLAQEDIIKRVGKKEGGGGGEQIQTTKREGIRNRLKKKKAKIEKEFT